MKDNGYHTTTGQKVAQDRAYPTVDQVLAERFPTYEDVFAEFHCKALPFETGSWGMIEPNDAHKTAWEILDNLEAGKI